MGGRVGGIGNKAQLRPAKLELGLGLSLAITNLKASQLTSKQYTLEGVNLLGSKFIKKLT